MKVKELIEKLKKSDLEKEVVIWEFKEKVWEVEEREWEVIIWEEEK